MELEILKKHLPLITWRIFVNDNYKIEVNKYVTFIIAT